MKLKNWEKIDEWIAIHEAQLLEDIKMQVEIPSVSIVGIEPHIYGDECAKAADCMMKLADDYGFDTENCAYRCVKISYGSGEKDIQIWNHLDVVPAGDGWEYPPYKCTRRDDFLIGRGVSDNKGAALAVLYSMRYLKDQEIKLNYHLSQICGFSEENGMDDAAYYLSKYTPPDFAFVSDCPFPLCYGEKGRCVFNLINDLVPEEILDMIAGVVSNSIPDTATFTFEGQITVQNSDLSILELDENKTIITAKGRAGHAAAPERCLNPIGVLGNALKNAKQLNADTRRCMEFLGLVCADGYGTGFGIDDCDSVFGRLSCAGTVIRILDGKINVTFDLRYPPSADLKVLLDKVSTISAEYGFRLANTVHKDGYSRNMDSMYIQTLIETYETIMKDGKKSYVMGGNTYAGIIPNAVGFGPGIPKDYSNLGLPKGHGGGHGCDEVQSISGLEEAIKIYILALLALNECF
ncbi:MAG: Sapep family Mn(2+)-dependent dipeptidase [Hungatella sp.]